MGFFFIENFNLPDGTFQPTIVTTTGGGGSITQSNSIAIIVTTATSDAAIITNLDEAKVSEFYDKSIKIKVGYNITSINTRNDIHVLAITQSTSPITLSNIGAFRIRCMLQNVNGVYKELWSFYTNAGSVYRYDGTNETWVASSITRNISQDIDYYINVIFNPVTKKFKLDNGSQTTIINSYIQHDQTNWYWFIGDQWTNYSFGTLKCNYINITDIGQKYQLRSRNNLLQIVRHSRSRVGGSALTEIAGYTNQNRIRLVEVNKIYGTTFNRIRLTEVNNT